jgi:hypothetical protein
MQKETSQTLQTLQTLPTLPILWQDRVAELQSVAGGNQVTINRLDSTGTQAMPRMPAWHEEPTFQKSLIDDGGWRSSPTLCYVGHCAHMLMCWRLLHTADWQLPVACTVKN